LKSAQGRFFVVKNLHCGEIIANFAVDVNSNYSLPPFV
jgi:hypothetical protein